MSEQHSNAQLLRDFHDAQNRFYAGADQDPAAALLTEDVTWHVPGRSAIAGEHRGRSEVLRHFARRRELARHTFRIEVRGVLADGERGVVFAEASILLRGQRRGWETVAVFRVVDAKIAECWVYPGDQYAFDEIWSAAVATPGHTRAQPGL